MTGASALLQSMDRRGVHVSQLLTGKTSFQITFNDNCGHELIINNIEI